MDAKTDLKKLCEPLFIEVCEINRIVRKGSGDRLDKNAVLDRIQRTLASIRAKAEGNLDLQKQYDEVEPILIYFVDDSVMSSNAPWRFQWEPPMEEMRYGTRVGGKQFFEMLDQHLQDGSAGATERLEIFYICIGLGFTGWYLTDPDYLEKKMSDIASRLRRADKLGNMGRIIPKNELNIDTSQLFVSKGPWFVVMSILTICLVLAVLIGNIVLYQIAVADLGKDLEAIHEASPINTDGTPKSIEK